MNEYPHYFKALPPGCTHVDVYRVLDLFGVVDPPIQHAVKKLLCAGERGSKTMPQDIAEAIATLQRWQQMRLEEATPVTDFNLYTSPDVWTSKPAPAAQTMPPADCRQRLILEGKAYPRSGCAVCGQFSPRGRDCYALLVAPKPAPAAEPTLRDDVERIRAVFAELPREHLDAAMDRLRAEREEDPEEDPAPAEAPEDAERAAYLERWKAAPRWAQWRAKDPDNGRWYWVGDAPHPNWQEREPRPTPAGGQGVGP